GAPGQLPTIEPSGKIEFADSAQELLYQDRPEITADEKKFHVTLVPRVYELVINAPSKSLDPRGEGYKFEMESAEKGWQPVPGEARKWSMEGGQGRLILMPAACGLDRPTGRVNLSVPGFRPLIQQLKATDDNRIDVTLRRPPRLPRFPAELE